MVRQSLADQVKSKPKIRSLFAEMYVAGALADENWAIYFPRRDIGFDMIATKESHAGVVVRPIQVKGLYPGAEKSPKSYYGYIGGLSQTHKDMALVIVYFDVVHNTAAPNLIAWMPWTKVRRHPKGYKCQPAKFVDGRACARRDYRPYFGGDGLARMESPHWK